MALGDKKRGTAKRGGNSAGNQAQKAFQRLYDLPKGKSQPVSFRLQTELYQRLEHKAREYGMTPGAYARWRVCQELDEEVG